MKLMISFSCVLHNSISVNFEVYFLEFPVGNCFWCYFRQLITSGFQKMQKGL